MEDRYEAQKHDPALPEDARRQWIEADGAERIYRHNVSRIEEDPDLTPEAKKRKLLDLHADRAPVIEDKKKAARMAVLKAAEAAERNSWPRLKGMSLEPQNSSDLIAAQHEEAALVADYEKMKRRSDEKAAPFSPSAADYLRDRYKAGLEMGTVAGTARLRGCIGAANRLGVSIEDVVGPLRSQREYEALERAQRLMSYSDVISTKVSLPRSVQRSRRQPGRITERRGRGAAILMPGGGLPIQTTAPTHTGSKPRSKSKGKKK